MRVLFVEDEPELHEGVKRELEVHGISVTIAENAQQAMDLVDSGGFDLFLCDLKIPASLAAPAPNKQHGIMVYDHMRVAAAGVPIIIFTGYGELADLGDRLSEAQPQDLFGDGARKLVISRKKDESREVIAQIVAQHEALCRLEADIELSGPSARAALGDLDQRLVRVHARSHDAVIASMDLMAGGRSGACVLKLETSGADGALTSRVVAKLNALSEVEDELKRYRRYVPLLGAGAYTNHLETLRAGAQDRAALFFALAHGYDGSLFKLLRANDSSAAKTVRELKIAFDHGMTIPP
jgi:CheY-like chemotaxis protein